ncbi:GNAT family N-acetyltransferase [Allocatelliglobosispora scoriae]|uniref:GNAT family N-acetyltransferase n=1 Tax=Allocatelliglobosispora scoriae TaxID=643052 RepID=UPI001FECFAB9|nr:GNAT family N-acetyltransferase [Allocatelliglobosispora scoriae]
MRTPSAVPLPRVTVSDVANRRLPLRSAGLVGAPHGLVDSPLINLLRFRTDHGYAESDARSRRQTAFGVEPCIRGSSLRPITRPSCRQDDGESESTARRQPEPIFAVSRETASYALGVIRQAHVEDSAAIASLKVRAWRAAYPGILPQERLDALDPVGESGDWAEYIALIPSTHRLWVCEGPDGVIGFCRTGPAEDDRNLGPDAAEIYGLYVDPDHLGEGWGHRLFSHAIRDLTDRGLAPICVYYYESNTTARRFYDRAGFVADGGYRPDEDGLGIVEVRLVRPTT